MTGTWIGYYKYDNEQLQKASGFDKTYFTITIKSFDEKNFKGIVINPVKQFINLNFIYCIIIFFNIIVKCL